MGRESERAASRLQVFELIMVRIREKIRHHHYIVTLHCEEEMAEDDLTIYDVECALLKGIIVARQKDAATGEWKYRTAGKQLTRIRLKCWRS